MPGMHDILVVLIHSIVTFVRLIKPGGLGAVVAESAHSASIPHPESQSEASSQPACFRSHYRRFMHPSHAPISFAALRYCPKAIHAAHSDDVDQSFRSDADQTGAKRRRALSV